MNKAPAQYGTQGTREVAAFLDSVTPEVQGGATGQAILDNIKGSGSAKLPKALDEVLGRVNSADESRILDAVTRGMQEFHAAHGSFPTADVVEAAIQQGATALNNIDKHGSIILDSATSNAHDPGSLQPNRAVVAILSAIAEAIPFAAYLPVDIASNQSKLAILSHQAGSAYGDYALGGIMDGVACGDVYASSSRMVRFDHSGAAPWDSRFTTTNLTGANAGFCDAAGTGVPVLRGRTIVFANGKVAAVDAMSGSAANSPISGSVTLAGVSYAITGYVTVATGQVQVTAVTPALPADVELTAQSFVNYEASPGLIPSVIVRADVYDIFANPWRVMTGISVDAAGQIKNELGLDAESEALMAIRTQMSMERHYLALRMVTALGANNVVDYDFDYTNQIQQKQRWQVWQDFQSVIANADQKMANDTMDHGITHLYVSAFIAAQMAALPSDLFVSSGITARPGIYRVGRLFGKYDVYYSPKGPTQSADLKSASLVAVGRSSQVARCPVVLGDAVSPTFLPLNMQSDLKRNAAMYARDFTVVNPHEPSALGCAKINVTNLF